jgi:hypothetical protein
MMICRKLLHLGALRCPATLTSAYRFNRAGVRGSKQDRIIDRSLSINREAQQFPSAMGWHN